MTPEKRIENQIRKQFEQAGGYINKMFASPNTNKGIPDLIGCLNGVYVALEIKRLENGKPTPVQIKNLQAIANAGGMAFVTNDPNLIKPLKRFTKHPKVSMCLNTKTIVIDHQFTTSQLTPTQATHLWHQHTGAHSLQIISKEGLL